MRKKYLVNRHTNKIEIKQLYSKKHEAARKYVACAFTATQQPVDTFDPKQTVPKGTRFVKHLQVAMLCDYPAKNTKTLTREVTACILANVDNGERETKKTGYFRDFREPLVEGSRKAFYHRCRFQGEGFALHNGIVKFEEHQGGKSSWIYVIVDDIVERKIPKDDNLVLLVDSGKHVRAGDKLFYLKRRAPSRKLSGFKDLNYRQFNMDEELDLYEVFSALDDRCLHWTKANDERWRDTFRERKAELEQQLDKNPPEDVGELAALTRRLGIYNGNKPPAPKPETDPESWGPIQWLEIPDYHPTELVDLEDFTYTDTFKRDFMYWVTKGAPIRARTDCDLVQMAGYDCEDEELSLSLAYGDGSVCDLTFCISAVPRKVHAKKFEKGDIILYLLPEFRHQTFDSFEEISRLLDNTLNYFAATFLGQSAVYCGEYEWFSDNALVRRAYISENFQEKIIADLWWDIRLLAQHTRDNSLFTPPPVKLQGSTGFKAGDLLVRTHLSADPEFSLTEVSLADKTAARKARKGQVKSV